MPELCAQMVNKILNPLLKLLIDSKQLKTEQNSNRMSFCHQLTCAVDVLETLLVGVHEPLVHVCLLVPLSLMVSVVAVVSVPVHVGRLATGAPSPAFAAITSRHRDADVNGLMVWGQRRMLPKWLHEHGGTKFSLGLGGLENLHEC